jgi:hypothetical protein
MDLNYFQLAFGLSVAYLGHILTQQNRWETILQGCGLVAVGVFSTISALVTLEILP